MTSYNHLICHFYCKYSVLLAKFYPLGYDIPEEA
jgi:hypothetical protein